MTQERENRSELRCGSPAAYVVTGTDVRRFVCADCAESHTDSTLEVKRRVDPLNAAPQSCGCSHEDHHVSKFMSIGGEIQPIPPQFSELVDLIATTGELVAMIFRVHNAHFIRIFGPPTEELVASFDDLAKSARKAYEAYKERVAKAAGETKAEDPGAEPASGE